jgi:hypothetical protein
MQNTIRHIRAGLEVLVSCTHARLPWYTHLFTVTDWLMLSLHALFYLHDASGRVRTCMQNPNLFRAEKKLFGGKLYLIRPTLRCCPHRFFPMSHQSPFKACGTGYNFGTYRVFSLRLIVDAATNPSWHFLSMAPTTKRSQCKRVTVVLSAAFIAVTSAALFSVLSIKKPVYLASPKRRRRVPFLQIESGINDSEFTRTFQMPREAFHSLCRTMRLDLLRDEGHRVRCRSDVIEPETRLAVTLRLLAGSSYLDLVLLFRLAKSTVYAMFHATVDIINRRLEMPGFPIGEPPTLSRLADAVSRSRTPSSPLYGCVGAIDGITVAIMKPPDAYVPRNFYCRKCMYCLPVQAIVDAA